MHEMSERGCLRGHFGPSGKWAASTPSKGWGRTHIANSSRPGTFKRPGAAVAIRAPATQALPPVAGEGKLPTAIPIFQPWSRCHRTESTAQAVKQRQQATKNKRCCDWAKQAVIRDSPHLCPQGFEVNSHQAAQSAPAAAKASAKHSQ